MLLIPPMHRAIARALVAAIVATAAPGWAQLCGPTDDPCVMSSSVTVPGDTVIDLGSRDLVIAASQVLTVQGTGNGTLSISARNITLENGARIVAPGPTGIGGTVTLVASGALAMVLNSRIDTTGASAGDVALTADTAILEGQIRAAATTRDGDGGYVSLVTAGDASISGGGMLATGGNGYGFGGFVDVFAGGNLVVSSALETKGGEGSDIDLQAGGDLTVDSAAELNGIATLESGDGGSVSLTANGFVSSLGHIDLRSAGSLLEGAGDAGDVDIIGDSVELGGLVEMVGAGPDGSGGFLDVFGTTDVTVSGTVLVSGAAEGVGGDVLLDASSTVTVASSIDVRGGFAGGSFEGSTLGLFDLRPGVTVTVADVPGGTLGGYGGDAYVEACHAQLAGTIDASGLGPAPRATVTVKTGGGAVVSGTILGPSGVTFMYRSEPPSIEATATIVPTPVLTEDPTLACCVLCDVTTSTTVTTSSTQPPSSTSSTTTTTSSTTSSSMPASTSTVTTVPSSSTTVVISTTTTTLPPSCLDEALGGFSAIECAVAQLDDMVQSQSMTALGGTRSAKRLAGKVAKTSALVEKARGSNKSAKLLRKAEKKVRSFQKQIAKLLARAKIADPLAEGLLDLSDEVSVRIDGVLTPPAS